MTSPVLQVDTVFDGKVFTVEDAAVSRKIVPNKRYKILVLPVEDELQQELEWILRNQWWVLFGDDFRSAIDEMLAARKNILIQERNLFE